MKVPTARKLPSGSWFVRVQVNGQSITITKSTEKAAIAEAVALKTGAKEVARAGKMSITNAIDQYIEVRESICSPSTIRGYRIIQNTRFKSMMQKDIFSATHEQWQRSYQSGNQTVFSKNHQKRMGFHILCDPRNHRQENRCIFAAGNR